MPSVLPSPRRRARLSPFDTTTTRAGSFQSLLAVPSRVLTPDLAPRFMTQTRPANLFEASPSDSPSDSVASTIRRRAPDSESQRMTQTQLEATQTPTQAPRGLQRSHALIDDDSFDFEMAATEVQPEPTEVEPETQETQSEMDYYPSAAQPTRTVVDPPRQNAFAVLLASKQAQGPEPGRVEKQGKNAFVDTEADMSEDEYGFGKASGDEDEAGMDAELESLVDNDEVDRDLGEEQDALAQQRYMYVLRCLALEPH